MSAYYSATARARANRTGSTASSRGGVGLAAQTEEVSYVQGSTTVKLRPMPPQAGKPTEKLGYLNEAIRKVLGTTASDGDKRELLVQAFGDVGSTAAGQVDIAMLSFHNAAESVAPQLANQAAFRLTDVKYYKSTGTVVNLPANPTAAQEHTFRANATYAEFNVDIVPSAVIQGFSGTKMMALGFRLSRTADPDDPGNTIVDPRFLLADLRDARALVNRAELIAGRPVQTGRIEISRQRLTLSEESAKKEFRGFLDTIRLNITKEMIKQQYMGADHADESEIIEALRNTKAVVRTKAGLVMEVELGTFLTKYLGKLQAIEGQGGSYGFDIVEAYRNSLTRRTKNLISAKKVQIPPYVAGESKAESDGRLRRFSGQVEHLMKEVRTTRDVMGIAQPPLANAAVPPCLVGMVTVSNDPDDAANTMPLGDLFPEAEAESTAVDPTFQYIQQQQQQQQGAAVYAAMPTGGYSLGYNAAPVGSSMAPAAFAAGNLSTTTGTSFFGYGELGQQPAASPAVGMDLLAPPAAGSMPQPATSSAFACYPAVFACYPDGMYRGSTDDEVAEFCNIASCGGPITKADVAMTQALIFSSVCEKAMAEAQGLVPPPPRTLMTGDQLCFGCGRVPELKDAGRASHFWRDCPNKSDLRVQQAFQQGRREFLEKKRAERGGTGGAYGAGQRRQFHQNQQGQPPLQRQRTDQGGASAGTAANLALAAPTNNSTGTGTGGGNDINKPLNFFPVVAIEGDSINEVTGTTVPVSLGLLNPGPEEWDPITQLTIPIANAGLVNSLKAKLGSDYDPSGVSVSMVLPFFSLPIGEEHSNKYLDGMADTGAGCSLGDIKYHSEIARRHPELILQIVDLDDIPGGGRFALGGVGGKDEDGGNSSGCMVTHVMSFKTSFEAEGRKVVKTIALATRCASTTIFGLPFMIKAGISILLPSMSVVSNTFGAVFPLSLKRPVQDADLPEFPDGAPVTLTAIKDGPRQTARVLLPLAGDQCNELVRGMDVINNRIKDHREAFVKEIEIDNLPTGTTEQALTKSSEDPGAGTVQVHRPLVQDPAQEAWEKVRMDRAVYSFPTTPSTAPLSMESKPTSRKKPSVDQWRSLLSSAPRAVLKQLLQEILAEEQIAAERQ